MARFLTLLIVVLFFQLIYGIIADPCLADTPITDFQPCFHPTIKANKITEKIEVDGNLNDSGWHTAEHTSDFVERFPGDNTRPEVTTEVFLAYDNDNLYIAFVCHDDPSTIRATMCGRDQYLGDDAVCVLLDTYGQATWAYELFVNSYGIQKDRLWSKAGEDQSFDLIWKSAAQTTDSGYQVEIAIPFSALRFPNRDIQTWRMDFWRNRFQGGFHQYSWAAYDRDEQCWACQWGTVEGICGVQPGKGIEFLPSFIANQSSGLVTPDDPHSRFEKGDILGEFSIGGKYAMSSDMTLEATYNPDFSQIEADAAQVDVNSTIALQYPERRPFFQEGSDVFRTMFNSFYTRTINDPQYAVKLISRKPGFTFGFMSAQDENTPYMIPLEERSILFNAGRSYVNIFRGCRSIGKASQLGFIVTDRRLDGGGYGSILSTDGNIRITPTLSINGQFIASFTGEPDKAGNSSDLADVVFDQGKRTAVFDGESFHGNAFITTLTRSARNWNFTANYNQVDPSYRTEIGYDPWVDYRDASIWSGYMFYPKHGPFLRIQPEISVENRWQFDGTRKWEHQNFELYGQLRWAQTEFEIAIGRGSESWTRHSDGHLAEYDDLFGCEIDITGQIIDELGYSFTISNSREVALLAEAIGNQTDCDASLTLKPIDRLTIEPEMNYVRNTHVDTKQELFRQLIVRTRLQLQLNRKASVRLVLQYDDSKLIIPWMVDESDQPLKMNEKTWGIDPLITYRLGSFSVLYLGSTYDYTHYPEDEFSMAQWKLNSRQYFMKLQYLIQM